MSEVGIWGCILLSGVVGVLIGYLEGNEHGWKECGKFYREEVIPHIKRSRK